MDEHDEKVSSENEKRTLIVIILTLITMFLEVAFGYITHSMGLLADGYHMLSHAIALGLAYIAYVLIRKLNNSPLFPNGTDKIGTIAAYTSSLFLGLTGIWIIVEAVGRFIKPLEISFNDAIVVAVVGLIVNAVCAFIMEGHHEKEDNRKNKEDYNYKAAYYHILADALTSVLAIVALLVGKYFNFIYLDSLIGILGGILILKWSLSLIKKTVIILIDMKKQE